MAPLATVVMLAAAASPELGRAERAFEEGRFDEVLISVNRSLDAPLTSTERLRAYHLKAMTHAAFDDGPSTVEAFRRALGVDPKYSPGAEASPKILASFDDAKKQGPLISLIPAPARADPEALPADEPVYKRAWFWGVVIGVVIAGTAAGGAAAVWPKRPAGNLGTAPLP